MKIIADSCCDLSEELKKELKVEIVPLKLQLDEKVFVDDDNIDINEYIKSMRESKKPPKSACPAPANYMDSYAKTEDEEIFVITLSNRLSGSYNSAVLAKNISDEEGSDKKIHIFDSLSASIAETLIALKINELDKIDFDYHQIVENVTKYISEMKTFFVLDNLQHLAKNGRLNPIIARLATVLNVKLLLGSNGEGEIKLVNKFRGYKKAFKQFVEVIGKEGVNLEDKVLGIAHCNCLERALEFKKQVLQKYNFKDIIIVPTAGVSTTYADEGGIVVAF